MTTGTPLDLTPFGAVLTGLGIVYWLLAAGAMLLAVLKPKTLKNKSLATVAVLMVFGWSPALEGWARYKAQQKLNVAMARFEERCKTAGEKIYRTVENVEGVLLMNVRAETSSADRADRDWPDAALPGEGEGDWYVRTFLFWEQRDPGDSSRGYVNEKPSPIPGYRFVDVLQADASYLRYRIKKPGEAVLAQEKVSKGTARYAVSFTNMMDPEDRKVWIAGTKVVVTDTVSNEVIAEKTWYAIDPGQGSTAGFRSPWKFSKKCPSFVGWSGAPTRFFVDQVLKPKKGE